MVSPFPPTLLRTMNRTLTSAFVPALALVACLSVPAFAADPAPAPAPAPAPPAIDIKPAPAERAEGAPEGETREQRRERMRGDWQKRLIEENPELAGVDPNTEEGQAKIAEVMKARFEKEVAPQIRERMAAVKVENRKQLQEDLGMKDDEFTAIGPLLDKVETLRTQKGLVDAPNNMRAFIGGGRGGRGGRGGGFGGAGGFGNFDATMLLGDTPMEPSVKSFREASAALKTLLADGQSKDAEISAAMAQARKARAEFQAALQKAETELKAVLTPRQEAQLVQQGLLD